jgi:hypothetical protein
VATATVKRVTKKQLTLTQAADQWEQAKRAIDKNKPLLEEAAAVLKDHFEKTGRRTFRDRIAYAVSTRTVLDQQKVREFLGRRLPDFQSTSTVKSLSLLNREE